MAIDSEGVLQLEAIKTEKDSLKKFKMYFDYLKDAYKNTDGTITTIETENLTNEELEVYDFSISFFRSLNADNCDLKFIDEGLKEILKKLETSKEKNFIAWIRNKISPLSVLKYMPLTWGGEDGPESGIEFLVNETLKDMDPARIF